MSMIKTGVVAGKVKKIQSDEELDAFEKQAQSARNNMKKQAEKVKHDPSKEN